MMNRLATVLGLVLLITVTATAQKDDFRREGKGDRRDTLDAMEGKAPPALDVTGWMNTGNKAPTWSDYAGRVVLIDFWGVW